MSRLPLLGLVAALGALAGPARAQESTDIALVAFEIHQMYCADIGVGEVVDRADALVRVGRVWGDVDAEYQREPAPWLLYWRGTLAQCLGQAEAAEEDLARFVREAPDDPALASQVQDAKRRLRLIKRGRGGQGGRAVRRAPEPRPKPARPEREPRERRERARVEPKPKPRPVDRPAFEPGAMPRLTVEAGAALALLGRMTESAVTPVAEGAGTIGVAYTIRTPVPTVGVGVGLTYGNLPVSGCDAAQTRGQLLALSVGPLLSWPVSGRARLRVRLTGHLGALGTWPRDAQRLTCQEAAAGLDDGDVPYGARIQVGGASARVSYQSLGWRGGALALGGELAAGPLWTLPSGTWRLGGLLFLRHDQLFAVIPQDTYYLRDESTDEIVSFELGPLSGAASMARLQIGVRLLVGF